MIFAGGLLHLAVVALPLIAFGRLANSLHDPATLVFLLGASALYAGDAVTMRWTPSEPKSPLNVHAKRWALVTGTLLLVLFWMCLVERAVSTPASSWLQALGVALLFSGIALRTTAVRTLGKSFRTEIEGVDGSLVQNGIYRFVRHPSETGLLAASLGTAILLQSALGLVVWGGALVPVTLARLSLEERALTGRFGETYERYAERVGRLLPL